MTGTALEKAETQLANAEKKLSQKKARLDDLKARQKKQARRDDTRQKILLGSTLQSLTKTDPKAQNIIDFLISQMSEKDRMLFSK